MKQILFLAVIVSLLFGMGRLSVVLAGEGEGWPSKTTDFVSVETEFFAGQRGYLHGGLSVEKPLGEKMDVGLKGHFVRESSGTPFFPSLKADFSIEILEKLGLEVFSFGYLPQDRQYAVAGGIRAKRELAEFSLWSEEARLHGFFSPVFASVRAIDEDTDSPVTIGHFMLLAGVELKRDPFQISVFGNQSFFTRDTAEHETHVDLEEMTHIAVYENTDGFARNSVGTEIAYSPIKWLTLTARYAAIWFEGLATRHSVFITPSVAIGEGVEIFAGVQILRGGERGNNLGMGGAALAF